MTEVMSFGSGGQNGGSGNVEGTFRQQEGSQLSTGGTPLLHQPPVNSVTDQLGLRQLITQAAVTQSQQNLQNIMNLGNVLQMTDQQSQSSGQQSKQRVFTGMVTKIHDNCAYVLVNNTGGDAICSEDVATIIMCKQWVGITREDQRKEVPSATQIRAQGAGEMRLTNFCLKNGVGSPLCAWLCAWNPYCGPRLRNHPRFSGTWQGDDVRSFFNDTFESDLITLFDYFPNLTPIP